MKKKKKKKITLSSLMYKKCIIELRPERNRVCQDDGSFLLNYKGCAKCHKRKWIKNINYKKEIIDDDDDDYQEIITYDHSCSECNFIICEHYYRFQISDIAQEYLMECLLCGRGVDCIPLKISPPQQQTNVSIMKQSEKKLYPN